MSDENEIRCYICPTPGLSGTTPVTIKKSPEGFEARMGFALFGSTNMDEDGFRAAQYNPFHDLFHDNFASGKGTTEQEAIDALKKEIADIHESLWA